MLSVSTGNVPHRRMAAANIKRGEDDLIAKEHEGNWQRSRRQPVAQLQVALPGGVIHLTRKDPIKQCEAADATHNDMITSQGISQGRK